MSQELGVGIMLSQAILETLRSLTNARETAQQMDAFLHHHSAVATMGGIDSPPARWSDGAVAAFAELSGATSRAVAELQAAEEQRNMARQQLGPVCHALRKARRVSRAAWLALLVIAVGLALWCLWYLGVI